MERILTAIENTKMACAGYFEKTLAQRAGLDPAACGSIYENISAPLLETALKAVTWEPYTHPAILSDCTGFWAQLPGRLGVVELASLPPESQVTLDDRKGTGTVSAIVKGRKGALVGFTVLILGPAHGVEVVYTFHPGAPVAPSQVQAAPGLHGKIITVAEALALGLTTAKIA